jgi:hypothetical protein
MTIESLEKEQKLLETKYIPVFGFGLEQNPQDSGSMPDGVVDTEAYLNSKLRVCWVLKEPYDSPDGEGDTGGWSPTSDVLAKPEDHPELVSSKTYRPIIYVTHSLQNGLAPYSEVDRWFVANKPMAAQCLRSIALINISKMPGTSKSTNANIAEKYEYWRPLLFWQLRQYQPQIIIFGNTFQHFQADLGIKKDDLIQGQGVSEDVTYAVKDNALYIHAYHPSQISITREKYVDGIINIVMLNLEKIEGAR